MFARLLRVSAGVPASARAAVRGASTAAASPAKSVFHDPSVRLTARQRQVYQSLADEPALPLMADHGYLYGTTEAQLEGRPEAVKRALSTRTGSITDLLTFRRSEILRKFATKQYDTGSSRVQAAMLTERLNRMSAHLSNNKHDKHCKRSLSAIAVRRRKVLEYMMRNDFQSYRVAVSELGLRPIALFHSRHLPKVRTETHKQVNERNRRLKNRTSRGYKGH